MIDYSLILIEKYKGSEFSLNANDYNSLVWYSSTPKPTREELDAQWEEVLSTRKKQDCKAQAQALLSESDWADLVSVRSNLQNVSEWDNYRNEVRQLRTNPVQNPVFPTKPQVLWVQQDGVNGGNA